MALLNVRSLLNKIFILQDYFTPHNLDFLFLTETWIKEGDLSPFTELVSLNCTFFSTSRQVGRGEGLAAIFKDCFHGRIIPAEVYGSFELQIVQF